MRAKFRVSSIAEGTATQGDEKVKVNERWMFDAVYSDNPESENRQWSKYTPYGHLEMQVDNPAAWGHFKIGQEVYLDFTILSPVEA